MKKTAERSLQFWRRQTVTYMISVTSLGLQGWLFNASLAYGSPLPKSKILTAIAWVLLPKSEIWTTLQKGGGPRKRWWDLFLPPKSTT